MENPLKISQQNNGAFREGFSEEVTFALME